MHHLPSQLMYNLTDGGRRFRFFNSVNLGFWHIYKHCATAIWEEFASSIMAPLWHTLYPDARFYPKTTTLPAMLSLFVQLKVAYPKVRARLQKTMSTELPPRLEAAVSDIKFLFEFAIPTVTCLFKHVMILCL